MKILEQTMTVVVCVLGHWKIQVFYYAVPRSGLAYKPNEGTANFVKQALRSALLQFPLLQIYNFEIWLRKSKEILEWFLENKNNSFLSSIFV